MYKDAYIGVLEDGCIMISEEMSLVHVVRERNTKIVVGIKNNYRYDRLVSGL